MINGASKTCWCVDSVTLLDHLIYSSFQAIDASMNTLSSQFMRYVFTFLSRLWSLSDRHPQRSSTWHTHSPRCDRMWLTSSLSLLLSMCNFPGQYGKCSKMSSFVMYWMKVGSDQLTCLDAPCFGTRSIHGIERMRVMERSDGTCNEGTSENLVVLEDAGESKESDYLTWYWVQSQSWVL